MKKFFAMFLVFTMLIAGLTGCGKAKDETPKGVTDTKSDKGLQTIGQNVKFEPNKLVNDGKPIQLEFWTWGTKDLFKSITDEYTKIYPNVTFKIVEHPWNDYWTKLPLALQNGNGPDVFNFHNSQHEIMINHMEPYAINIDDLKKDYMGVDAHVIDGKVYYIDYGFMTGAMYYNKKLWKEAGLTKKDIPKTWDEFKKVAKRLTKSDNSGKLTQAGFNYNGNFQSIIEGLNYQKGELLFKDDKKTVNIDNPVFAENTKFLCDLYNVDKVGSKDFGVDANESFGQGKTAIVYNWGWFVNYLPDNFPDIDWGVFNVPVFEDGKEPFAYDRTNGESTFGISKYSSNEKKAVAQDFVKFLLANDKYVKKLSDMFGVFPSKVSLKDDKDVLNNKLQKEIAKIIDRTIWPGPFPSSIENNLKQTYQDVMYNGKGIKDTLKQTQEKVERDMKNTNFTSVEDKYKYFNEKNK